MDGNPENIHDFIGDGGTEGGGGFKKPLRPVDDATIEVAVFPQMGPHVQDPLGWRKYKRAHWGFTIPRKDDPTKSRRITIRCIRQKGRGGMIVKECALCYKADLKKEQRDNYQLELKSKGKSDEEIKQLLAPLNEWLRKFNIDGKWVMFVRDAAGDYNRLHLSHKTFGDLESEMKKFSDSKKMNPRSPNNMVVWAITRVGKGKDGGKLVEKVAPAKEEVTRDGETFERIKVLKLTEDDLRKAWKEYEDLDVDESFVLTAEQIEALANCNEDPEVVQRIIEGKGAATANPPAVAAAAPATNVAAAPPPAAPATPSPAPAAPPVEDEVAKLQRMLEDAKRRAAAPVTSAPSTPAGQSMPAPTFTPSGDVDAEKLATMSNADLFAHLGIQPQNVGLPAK